MRFFFILTLATAAMAGEYTTYIGDTYPRTVAAITADAAGNTYVVGNRGPPLMVAGYFAAIYDPLSSIGIAALEPYPQPYPPNDVFVSKLDPTGKILFTAAFAGKGLDQGLAVTVDPTGNITLPGPPPRRIFPSATRCNRRTVRTARASSSNSARMGSRFFTPPILAGSPAPPASTP